MFNKDGFYVVKIIFCIYGDDVDAGAYDVYGVYVAETYYSFQNIFFFVNFSIFCQFQCFGKLVNGELVLFGNPFTDD